MSALDLEAILHGEEGTTAEEHRLAEVVAALRAEPPAAPPRLRTRVARAAEPAPPQRVRFAPPRRALLAVLAAAVTLAVFAAIVHGLVGSSGSKTSHALAKVPQGNARVPPAWQSSTVQSGSAHAPAAAGGSSAGVPYSSSTQRALGRMDSPSLTGGSRLQHVDASLRIRVANVDKLSQATTD